MKRTIVVSLLLMCLPGWQGPLHAQPRDPVAPPTPVASSKSNGETFDVDVGALRGLVDRLRIDERREQVADWAVYGTLFQYALSPEIIRTAMYDKVPVRAPILEEVARWDYGDGRRVILPTGETWIFHSERDAHPDATIARLADRVRAQTGTVPARVKVFAYRSDLARGRITVRMARDLAGGELFSPRYGYHSATVRNTDEFKAWLSLVDDLVHLRLLPGGAVELAGRRFESARTRGLALTDVAVLYQAHVAITKNHEAIDGYTKKVVDAFNALVRDYNSQTGYSRFGPVLSPSAYSELESLLQQVENPSASMLAQLKLGDSYENLLGANSGLPKLDGSYISRPSAWSVDAKSRIEGLRKRVDAVQRALYTQSTPLPGVGPRLPNEPGFSLDPERHAPGLAHDLERLLANPGEIASEAIALAASARADHDGLPYPSQTALDVREVLGPAGASQTVTFSTDWKGDLQRLSSALRAGGAVVSDATSLAIAKLEDKARRSMSRTDAAARALTLFVLARNHRQCARYDGPLQGTNVGMNLFYTDVLAKLWAGLDYGHEAPISRVLGFRTVPGTSPTIESVHWERDDSLPGTRLWFGSRPEAIGLAADGMELNFDHVASRVYAAGSDPLLPGKEEEPSEASGRVLSWWDRHFERVADDEQEYHVQNQIMKWSIATGLLSSQQRLAGLTSISRPAGVTFDAWYDQRNDLRYRAPLAFRPRSEWPSNRECIERLASRSFHSRGGAEQIRGGVSLGSAETLTAHKRYMTSTPSAYRSLGIVGEFKPGSSSFTAANGVAFNLPKRSGFASITLPSDRTVRGGGAVLQARQIETVVSRNNSASSVAINVGKSGLGVLEATRGPRGPRLSWTPGPMQDLLDTARAVSTHLNDPFQARFGGARPADTLHPAPGKYLLQRADGKVEAVVTSAPSVKAAQAIIIKPASAEDRAKRLLTTAQSGLSTSLGFEPGAIAALPAANANARRLVDASPWQVLRVGREPSDVPGAVERIFTHEAPAPDWKRVQLRTGDPRMPSLDALVGPHQVAIKRPSAAAGRLAFTDMFSDLQLSSRDVARVVESANTGAVDISLGHGVGRGSRAASQELPAGTAAPDERIRQAYAALHARDLDRAIQSATEAISDRGATGASLFAASQKAREFGGDAREVADFLFVKSGEGRNIPPRLRLEIDGFALHTVADAPGAGRRIRPEEVADAYAKGELSEVYVPDLAYLDWDAAPGETSARLLADQRIVWEKFDTESVFLPSELISRGDRLIRRTLANETTAGSAEAVKQRVSRTIYTARPSCANDNGAGVPDAGSSNCEGI